MSKARLVITADVIKGRVTDRLRVEVVEAYQAGQTGRQVAEESGLGRSTVLGILKDADIPVRPQGRKD